MRSEVGYWPIAIGLVLFGGAIRGPVSGLLVALGVAVGWIAWRRTDLVVDTRFAGACAALLGVLGLILGVVRNPIASPAELVAWPLAGIAASMAVIYRPDLRRPVVVVSGLMLFLASSILMTEIAGSDSGIDVYLSHKAATDALERGDDPYGEAVRVPNTSPFVEGEIIVGYSYPPVALAGFALSDLVTGDPRWATVLAIGALAVVGVTRGGAHPLLLVFLAAPIWRYFVFSGWTEALTLLLFVASAALWSRQPRLSAMLLGLALVSKQYLIVLLPVLLAMRVDRKTERLGWAAASGLITMVPLLVWSPANAFETLVARPLALGLRPDSQSLPGFLDSVGWGFEPPLIVLVGFVTVAGALAARRVETAADFLVAIGLVLGVAFSLGLAFPNYWLLVAGLATFGIALRYEETMVKRPGILPISSR